MKKKILLVTTGGTIASENSEEGLKPGLLSSDIMRTVNSLAERYDVTTRDLFQLDSSNIQPEEWQVIARCIYDARHDFDGVVVTHGTDTMAYTSSVLSFMLLNVPFPVVLTGSQLPISHPLTDAKDNLFCAFAMAASGTPGVFLAFNRKVMRGSRAVKVRTMSFDAFESINCPPVAKVDVGGLIINQDLVVRPAGDFALKSALSSDVVLIKIIPGLNPDVFKMLQNTGCRGVVIEAFGAGGMHFMRRDLISALQELADSGVVVVVCSQCLYESCDFSIYQTGMRLVEHPGIIQARDMTTEAAVTKLMWCLGQAAVADKIRIMFTSDISGEIDCESV
ncbi:asparaginase [Sporobacter termitidis DSM 10068]|uniref:asparaginase n=1 Tax=Sporobacter termitidis DSM 10068 TaxID=1123282 RepID=A0A1M5YKQ9_9FIRM|nr:asparaginase [Sporobacter termitidis]SHI12478.1 asparaginase [Sporobacter termitidis DSM 10068]